MPPSPCSDVTAWITAPPPPVEQNLFAHGEAPAPSVTEGDQGRCDLLKDVPPQVVHRRLRPAFNTGTISDYNFLKNSCLCYPSEYGIASEREIPTVIFLRGLRTSK